MRGAGYAAIGGVTPDELGLVTWFVKLGLMLGVLNLLQLVPLLPLDGGQVLRAIMQSFHAAWARRVMLGLGGLGASGFALAGDSLLAGVTLFGSLQAHMWRAIKGCQCGGIVVIAIGYALTIALRRPSIALSWLRIGWRNRRRAEQEPIGRQRRRSLNLSGRETSYAAAIACQIAALTAPPHRGRG
jgi:Zn-dependent protease